MADQLTEAKYWQPLDGQGALCLLCPHRCRIKPGHSGICQARRNVDGRLIAWSYAKITSIALDPIEKKPLHRFYPGSQILSVGSFGCNFHCGFCQNWTIAQQEAPFRLIQPAELVTLAGQSAKQGNIGLAYTYNEPLVGFEFVLDCARLIRQAGQKNVLVTNGFINPEPLAELLPYIDAMNIDLKAWEAAFYTKICGGGLEAVKASITSSAAACHIEVTTLLIPGLNDQASSIKELAHWLATIRPDIPLHLTRHHPDFKMQDPAPISISRLQLLAEIAGKELQYVYLGNV